MSNEKREGWVGYIAFLLVAVVAGAVVFALGKGYNDCEDDGGVLARGLGWYQCVEPAGDER